MSTRVRIHSTEVSTEGDSVVGYGEAIALVVAIVGLLCAMWIASAPSETAELHAPQPQQVQPAVIIPTPGSTAMQPTLQGPDEVVVDQAAWNAQVAAFAH